MAGCCGTPTMAGLTIAGMIDRGAASGALVKLVYIGSDATVRPYTIDGNVYMFGNTARRRVNAVAVRVLPFFLSAQSPHYGKFALWDEALYAADGSQKTEDSGAQRAPQSEVSGQKTEVSGQKTEDSGQKSDPLLLPAPDGGLLGGSKKKKE